MRFALQLVLALLLSVVALPALSQAKIDVSALDARLEALYKSMDFPGFAVAVTDREGVVYAQGFGLADREGQVPFTDETVMNIGSVSKTLIGVALMQALEREQVDLDAAIDSYLPYRVRHPGFPDVPITLRHLATHTSGIEDRSAIYRKSYSKGKVAEMSLGDYLRDYLAPEGKWFARSNFGKKAPGKNYEYSNIGAALAAHILEAVTGKGFDALTTEEILQPLGMLDSGWSYAAAAREKHARLYEGKKEVKPYTLVTYPDGGLRTSVASLARYLVAMSNQGRFEETQILKAGSMETMMEPQFGGDFSPTNRDDENSGIFWAHRSSGIIGHTGGDPGIAAVMFFDPESGLGRIFLTNTGFTKKNAGDFKTIWDVLKEAYVQE